MLKAASRTPVTVQQALSRLLASPRAFNLVVSNVPGPTVPMYILGCQLQAVYPMVPARRPSRGSVGMVTVHDQACFGIYPDRQTLPDVNVTAVCFAGRCRHNSRRACSDARKADSVRLPHR
jgi:hypothetical protein